MHKLYVGIYYPPWRNHNDITDYVKSKRHKPAEEVLSSTKKLNGYSYTIYQKNDDLIHKAAEVQMHITLLTMTFHLDQMTCFLN